MDHLSTSLKWSWSTEFYYFIFKFCISYLKDDFDFLQLVSWVYKSILDKMHFIIYRKFITVYLAYSIYSFITAIGLVSLSNIIFKFYNFLIYYTDLRIIDKFLDVHQFLVIFTIVLSHCNVYFEKEKNPELLFIMHVKYNYKEF